MADQRTIPPGEDPVCGMTVDPVEARSRELTLTNEDREYPFCGKGCMLEFRDDPATYVDIDYRPSM